MWSVKYAVDRDGRSHKLFINTKIEKVWLSVNVGSLLATTAALVEVNWTSCGRSCGPPQWLTADEEPKAALSQSKVNENKQVKKEGETADSPGCCQRDILLCTISPRVSSTESTEPAFFSSLLSFFESQPNPRKNALSGPSPEEICNILLQTLRDLRCFRNCSLFCSFL